MESRARFRLATFGWLVVIALPATAGAGASPQAGADLPPPDAYGAALTAIMSAVERASWDALDDGAGQAAFIEAFWEGRDPTPGTPQNELRDIFERRLRRAARLFAEGDVAGYATDRGRTLLRLGLPDEQEMRPGQDDGPAELTWTYGTGPYSGTLRFSPVGPGYALAEDPEIEGDAFSRSAESELRATIGTQLGGAGALVSPSTTTEGSEGDVDPEAVRAALAELAPEVRVWLQLVFGGVARDDLELDHRVDFFPAAEGTYTVLSFEVGAEEVAFVPDDESDESGESADAAAEEASEVQADADNEADDDPEPMRARLKLFGAVLEGVRGQENTVHQFIVPFTPPEPDQESPELPTRTVSVTLYPGTYRLAWGVLDEETERAVTRDEALVVPDFEAPGLRLTTPLIAVPPHRDDAAPIETGKLYPGVRLGRVLIADDLDRIFARDDIIEVVAVTTGWASDPASPGKPRLEVAYSVLPGLEGDRAIASIPPQVLDFSVLGQQIPLAQVRQLRAGESYRIRIHVRDLVSGDETVQTAVFHLAAEADAE